MKRAAGEESKSVNIINSLNRSLQSVLAPGSNYSSSDESLLTLLTGSLERQQRYSATGLHAMDTTLNKSLKEGSKKKSHSDMFSSTQVGKKLEASTSNDARRSLSDLNGLCVDPSYNQFKHLLEKTHQYETDGGIVSKKHKKHKNKTIELDYTEESVGTKEKRKNKLNTDFYTVDTNEERKQKMESNESMMKENERRKNKHKTVISADEPKPKKTKHHETSDSEILHNRSGNSKVNISVLNDSHSPGDVKTKHKDSHKNLVLQHSSEDNPNKKHKKKHKLSISAAEMPSHEDETKEIKKHKARQVEIENTSSIKQSHSPDDIKTKPKDPHQNLDTQNKKHKRKQKLSICADEILLHEDETKRKRKHKALEEETVNKGEIKTKHKNSHKHSGLSELKHSPEDSNQNKKSKKKHKITADVEESPSQQPELLSNDGSNTGKEKRKKIKDKHKYKSNESLDNIPFTDEVKSGESLYSKKKKAKKKKENQNLLDSQEVENLSKYLKKENKKLNHAKSPKQDKTEDNRERNITKRKHKLKCNDVYTSSESECEDDKGKIHKKKVSIDLSTIDVKDIDSLNDALNFALDRKSLDDTAKNELENLHVVVPWDIPLSHTIETRMSSLPTKEQQQKFKELNLDMKTGVVYTKAEDETIEANWLEFCKSHDLKSDPTPFLTFAHEGKPILNKEQRISFVRYLGKNLQHRMLSSIYRRFQTLFTAHKKGKFTPEEDDVIMTYIDSSDDPNKYSALSAILNRSRCALERRYQNLLNQGDKTKWDLPLMQKLVEQLMIVTKKQLVDELKHASITNNHWQEIENEMLIHHLKLRRKWLMFIYPRLFVEGRSTLHEIRMKIINKLYDLRVSDRKEIDWKRIALDFEGNTAEKLIRIFTDTLNSFVPSEMRHNFRASVKYLRNSRFLASKAPTKKILGKLKYKNGKLYEVQ